MSNFYFSWLGNKRLELKFLDCLIDWGLYTTVVEPFCGSCAFSLDLHYRGIDKVTVLNDIDANLMGMMMDIQEHKTSLHLYEYCRDKLNAEDWVILRDETNGITKDKNNINKLQSPEKYFYNHRVRGDYSRTQSIPEKWPSLARNNRIISTDALLSKDTTNITITDWRICMDKYKDDPEALIFLDPPYFNSFNQEYFGYGMDSSTEADGKIVDHTYLYIEMLKYLQTARARIICVINSCSITDYIFKNYIIKIYPKIYAQNVKKNGVFIRKSTNHVVLAGGCYRGDVV